ncbi:MAG: tRNA (adenosine(37)-N6)-threonylcarbamoyltransferase complex dimerization subunit type 1 TsaB [Prolixibacteraceae bacterium]|jgi:tRNA threonylcarbamoyladenosine biosynthesis protein TsaB|nr:tRNA (adenosine(37)-N6)-threonylcarbamoyltransferase complex dimerization subunit type 1 TsaB [Prolixibacteraceae bacterium]NLO03347.1 tRNA (adenosine(37)-N6)-threonylcarbamoyltransferase complex dimerization subunit type 1 TsaB [Bacteroidales bacterium]
MPIILNIETSSEVCSVAIARNGKLLMEKESLEGLSHSKLLSVFVSDIFKDTGIDMMSIDAVAVSKGPGSYTGLRIGVSLAKGLCYALDKPLIAVGSLDSLADHAAENSDQYTDDISIEGDLLYCPMIDARRMEVYTSLYNQKGEKLEAVSAKIINNSSFKDYLDRYPVLFFGNGSVKCQSLITHPNALFRGPLKTSARYMLNLAEEKFKLNEFEDVAYFEPFYLKDFIATIPGNKVIK